MSASTIAGMFPAARGAPAQVDEPGVDDGAAAGGEPCGERVERAAYFVDLGDPGGVERRDDDAAPGRVDDEPVLLEQAQRLQHRLARHRQPRRDVFLGQPGTGAIEPSLIASTRAR